VRKPVKSKQAEVRGICGAKTRSGGRCQLPAGWGTDHPGVGRCKLHGGATPRGADSPHFRHGLDCRYLPPADKDRDDVSEEQVVSAIEEVVGAIKWAEKLTQDPGPKPPLTVLAALRTVVEIKARAVQMQQALRQDGPLPPEVVTQLVGMFLHALTRAEVPDEYRNAIARELRKIAGEYAP